MIDAAALGEVLIDFTQTSQDDAGYPVLHAHPGGAPANYLAAAAAEGLRTAFLGKVGDDSFGRLLRRTLSDAGVDTAGLIADKSVFTTLAFVTLQNGERSFSFARKPGADTCLTPDEVNYDVVDGCRIFHFGTLSLTAEPAASATRQAAAYAKVKGKILSFDPNYRPPLWQSEQAAVAAMRYGLSVADTVKISEEEIALLYPLPPSRCADRLLEEYPNIKIAYITMGKKGCIVKTRHCKKQIRAFSVPVTDTTGAGDVFCGVADACLLKTGKSPERLTEAELTAAATRASAAAALAIGKFGGISAVPSAAEIDAIIKAQRA